MQLSVAQSYEHCRELARTAAGNFYYSFLTLPREQRRAMCALYAFMRVTDDLGDSDAPVELRAAQLAEWRRSFLSACETGEATGPVLPAVADMLRRYPIPHQYLLDVVTGVEMDLAPTDYATFGDLERYCYHVAGAVGLACIHLWGFAGEESIGHAIACGTALQLTNILRDLKEDAARGRVYLPREDLERFGVDSRRFAAGDAVELRRDDRFRALMKFEIDRARACYARGWELLRFVSPAGKSILEAMLRIYGGILEEIERQGFDVFSRRVSLSRSRKLLIVGGVLARGWGRRLVGRG